MGLESHVPTRLRSTLGGWTCFRGALNQPQEGLLHVRHPRLRGIIKTFVCSSEPRLAQTVVMPQKNKHDKSLNGAIVAKVAFM
jgi:hypothetical protein